MDTLAFLANKLVLCGYTLTFSFHYVDTLAFQVHNLVFAQNVAFCRYELAFFFYLCGQIRIFSKQFSFSCTD